MHESAMKERIKEFFKTYEDQFNIALEGKADLEKIAGFYSEEFIAANPSGVKAGENNNELKEAMDKGYEYYRSIGTKKMECKEVQITPLDDKHAVAHTKWNSVYLKDEEEVSIPFKNNYLIKFRDGKPIIFGWITGDESQLLKDKGII
ncbi:nuclear transport factor 2 family protein [Alteribacillus sp. HJP-4]|uniref:nuclear transport factor 2 family protein n=1 Tax=Alteribacillus sp. HJP-4 TaxID=2775394 RepID=UPI0035CD1308